MEPRWNQTRIDNWWEEILNLRYGAFEVEFRTRKSMLKNLFSNLRDGSPFRNDPEYKEKFFWFILRPLLLAIEILNRDPKKEIGEKDVNLICRYFSPATISIDHITFVVDRARFDAVERLFVNAGFELRRFTYFKEGKNNSTMRGAMLAKSYGCGHDDDNLFIALREDISGRWWQVPNNPFAYHLDHYGERTPFEVALDMDQLVLRPEKFVTYQHRCGPALDCPNHIDIWTPQGGKPIYKASSSASDLHEYLTKRQVLPIEPGSLSHRNSAIDPAIKFSEFSTQPLKYGLRIKFLRRSGVVKVLDPKAEVPEGEIIEEEKPRGTFPI